VKLLKFVFDGFYKFILFCGNCADIDVAEPDERSIVTYVSLLYDVFPNVPSLEQSLRDNVSLDSMLVLHCLCFHSF